MTVRDTRETRSYSSLRSKPPMTSAKRIERFDVPTLEMLIERLTPDPAKAEAIRAVLSQEISPEAASAKCAAWVRSCYNEPSWHEKALEACNEILDTCGVEALNIEGALTYWDDGVRMCPPFSYCNTGDPYETTLARDHVAGQW